VNIIGKIPCVRSSRKIPDKGNKSETFNCNIYRVNKEIGKYQLLKVQNTEQPRKKETEEQKQIKKQGTTNKTIQNLYNA